MKKLLCIILLSIVLLIAGQPSANAKIVKLIHTGYGASDIITVWGGGLDGVSGYAGVYILDTLEGESIPSFCIELSQTDPVGFTNYRTGDLGTAPVPTQFLGGGMGEEKAIYIEELFSKFYDSSWESNSSEYDVQAEAFAAAIWEIIYEDIPKSPAFYDVTIDGTDGQLGFRCTNADTGLANSWLHLLDGTGVKVQVTALKSNLYRDYVTTAGIPEPATMCLLGIGGLIFIRRKI